MARAQLGELGWHDRQDLGTLMHDLAELAGRDWRSAADLWDKFRSGDPDKPLFIDGDDKDPDAQRNQDNQQQGRCPTRSIARTKLTRKCTGSICRKA